MGVENVKELSSKPHSVWNGAECGLEWAQTPVVFWLEQYSNKSLNNRSQGAPDRSWLNLKPCKPVSSQTCLNCSLQNTPI